MPFFGLFKSKKEKKKNFFAQRNQMLDDIESFQRGDTGEDAKERFQYFRKKRKSK